MVSLRRLVATCAVAAALLAGTTIAALYAASGPTSEELAGDIAGVEQRIREASDRAAQYNDGSLLRVQVETELAVLRTTRALLDQKRLSWFRGIELRYTISGQEIREPSPEAVAEMRSEIARLEGEIDAASAKADQYTGGMIRAMALMEEQTLRVTLAFARQRLVMSRFRMEIPAGSTSPANKDPPLGRSTNDKGAL